MVKHYDHYNGRSISLLLMTCKIWCNFVAYGDGGGSGGDCYCYYYYCCCFSVYAVVSLWILSKMNHIPPPRHVEIRSPIDAVLCSIRIIDRQYMCCAGSTYYYEMLFRKSSFLQYTSLTLILIISIWKTCVGLFLMPVHISSRIIELFSFNHIFRTIVT
jgi:hypothetical protein